MRYMMFIHPGIESADWMPSKENAEAMGAYNDALAKAGVLLALDGLHSPDEAVTVSGKGGKVAVTDGPYTEAKEMIGGYWILEVSSREEALEWARRCPAVTGPAQHPEHQGPVPYLELRQIFDMSEFSEELKSVAGANLDA